VSEGCDNFTLRQRKTRTENAYQTLSKEDTFRLFNLGDNSGRSRNNDKRDRSANFPASYSGDFSAGRAQNGPDKLGVEL
jgi:hypothetical protein